MSDRDNLEALKRLIENKQDKEAEELQQKERRFISDAARVYLGDSASEKAIKEYEPEKMIAYLQTPPKIMQKELGGEWAAMPTDEFELFVYSIEKKIRKSISLMDWKNH